MINTIFEKSFKFILKKPFRLWGISLLGSLLCCIFSLAFLAVPVVGFCLCLALSTSMTMIFLYSYRGKNPEPSDLFECLKDMKTAKRVIGGMLWANLWVFLWGLIPIVGIFFAIKKSYAYRLTPYILVLEDDVKITSACKVSEERTNGYKGLMFLADLFAALLLIPAALILFIPIVGVFVYLLILAIYPLFVGIVQAAFYEEIMNGTAPFVESDVDFAAEAASMRSATSPAQETPTEGEAKSTIVDPFEEYASSASSMFKKANSEATSPETTDNIPD